MRVDFIIDGYNLLHAAGFARRRYGPGDLTRARNRLLNLIRRGLTQRQRACTTIVFDGQGSDSPGQPEFSFHGMLVIFSPVKLEADDIIEGLILENSAPKQLVVVSSDHRLHKAARARRATPVDSEEFVEQLRRFAQNAEIGSVPPPTKQDEKTVAADSEDWLAEFGDIDIHEIEAAVRKETRAQAQLVQKPSQPGKRVGTPAEPVKNGSSPESLPRDDAESQQHAFDLEFWEKRIAELDHE